MKTPREDRYTSQPDAFIWLSEERACLTCKRKHDNKQTCKAFPKRIAKDILHGSECSEYKEK